MEQVLATIRDSYSDVLPVLIFLPIVAVLIDRLTQTDYCINHINIALFFFTALKFSKEDLGQSREASDNVRKPCYHLTMCRQLFIATYLLDSIFVEKDHRISRKAKLLTYASYYTITVLIIIPQTILIKFGELNVEQLKTYCSTVNTVWISEMYLLQYLTFFGFGVYLFYKHRDSRREFVYKLLILLVHTLLVYYLIFVLDIFSTGLETVFTIMIPVFISTRRLQNKLN